MAQVQVGLQGNLEENTLCCLFFIGDRGPPEHYDTETRWCCMLVWCMISCFLLLFDRWLLLFLCQRTKWNMSPCKTMISVLWWFCPRIGWTGWFWKGGSSGRVDTNMTWTKRHFRSKKDNKNQPGHERCSIFWWGDQINTNQTHGRFLGFLRGVGFEGGTYWHDLPPSPGHWAPGSYGAIGVGWVATASGQLRRLRPCCWEGLAWLAFREIRGISP